VPLPLHKSPQGLLELFRLRQFGRAPDEFGSIVFPVVEVGDSYACQSLLTSGGTVGTGAIAPNLTASLTLSADLRIRAFCGRLTIGAAAATNVALQVGVLLPGTSLTEHPLNNIFYPAIGIGGIVGVSTNLGQPITLRAGSVTYARASGTAAGADHQLYAAAVIEFTPP
jgi:hypothetical protein